MKTKIAIIWVAVTGLVLISCSDKTNIPALDGRQRRTMAAAPIEGAVVRHFDINPAIEVSGTVRPYEETVLMPDISGRVVSINMPEGREVKKGTLLVKLYDADLQAQLKKSRAQLDIARQTEARLAQLVKINGVSQSDYDQAVVQVSSVGADVEVLEVQIRKTEILAPFDGVLGLRQISPGAQVTPSTPLATIRSVDKLKLDFNIPEKYSAAVTGGAVCRFKVDGDTVFHEARVMATDQGIDAETRTLKVRAVIDSVRSSLTPGAFARVFVQVGSGGRILMIPTQAVIPNERSKTVIVSRAGKAQFVSVNTGIRRDDLVEVTRGLAEGDTLAVTGLLFIKPGAELNFSKIER